MLHEKNKNYPPFHFMQDSKTARNRASRLRIKQTLMPCICHYSILSELIPGSMMEQTANAYIVLPCYCSHYILDMLMKIEILFNVEWQLCNWLVLQGSIQQQKSDLDRIREHQMAVVSSQREELLQMQQTIDQQKVWQTMTSLITVFHSTRVLYLFIFYSTNPYWAN